MYTFTVPSILICSWLCFITSSYKEWRTLRSQSSVGHGAYSLEFELHGSQCVLSLKYWNADNLTEVQLCKYSLSSDPGPSQLLMISRLVSFLSTSPQTACMSGCTSEVLQAVELSTLFKNGTEYPFRFDALSLTKLMHQLEGSVFDRIDFFTQLKYLLAFLNNSLGRPWMCHCPELTKV